MRTRVAVLPFGYVQGYVPYRKRNEDTVLLRDTVPVELRDLTGPEAPVAFTLVRHDHYEPLSAEDRERFYPEGAPVIDYRVIDGRLLLPLGEGRRGVAFDEFSRSVDLPAAAWRRGFGRPDPTAPKPAWSGEGLPRLPCYGKAWSLNAIRYPMGLPTAREFLADARDAREPVRLRGDNRAECLALAAAGAEQLAVVDGTVWSAVDACEPSWIVVAGGDGKIRLSLTLGKEPLSYVHHFRLDRLEEARAFAARLGSELAREVEETVPEVRIVDPSVLRLDEAVETARQFLSHLGWSGEAAGRREAQKDLVRLGESLTPEQAGEAYVLVRDGLAEGTIEPDGRLAPALARFAGMVPMRPELAFRDSTDDAFLSGLGL